MTGSPLKLRAETQADHQAIYDLTKRAFAPMPFAGGNEQDLINQLRKVGALTLSFVAEQDGEIVGHIAFSPATGGGDEAYYALGPVSVNPDLQKLGIGSALINEGIARLKAIGAAGCILTGNPTYYQRFGFVVMPELAPANEPAQYFMVLHLLGEPLTNTFAFHPAFYL